MAPMVASGCVKEMVGGVVVGGCAKPHVTGTSALIFITMATAA
jgi:hypothetical protein